MGKTHKSHKNAKGPTPQLRSRNTRSSKGRLLTETSSSTTQLTAQLSLLGLYAAPTIGDGNCLFRALSDQLYGSPSRHHELRQQICDHIAMYESRYEPFVEDERGLEAHLRAMRENATYGGHMELSAFAHMMRRNVKVIQPGLVYVIEWNAGGWEDLTGPTAVSAGPSANVGIESSTTPRRMPRRSTNFSPSKAKEMNEDAKIKLGKGYYVYEEISSGGETDFADVEEVEGTLPNEDTTIYVAYHDWEHFSSIRNLRGPHTGLPDVVETPPPAMEESEQVVSTEREKERDRERKKERERKEKLRKEKERERKSREKKERDKETDAGSSSGTLKVKLKLPPSVSANTTLPASVDAPSMPQVAGSVTDLPSQCDPSLIPLPISRSASPFIGSYSSLVASSAPSPLPSSSLANEVYPEDPSPLTHICASEGIVHDHPHLHAHVLQTPRSHYRSPKRTFDESSASGTEEDPENSKRSRRRVCSTGWSGPDASSTQDVSTVGKVVEDEVDKGDLADSIMHVDADAEANEIDPPSLSPGRSSSPLSSVASSVAPSVSGTSSEVDVDDQIDLESQADDPDNDATAMLSSSPKLPAPLKTPRQQHLPMHGGQGKPLTRRQRKALGLPKQRQGVTGSFGGTTNLSAGKIIIPGGKWKGRDDSAGQTTTLGVVGSLADGEWRRNGTGRLDVRGFRELKI